MLTDHGSATSPASTVGSLEDDTPWDGPFHASTRAFVVVGPFVLWRALSEGYRATRRSLVGLLLAGWGVFDLVEGVVDHHVLTVHHARGDVADPLGWDLGFLAFGASLAVVGPALRRSDRGRSDEVPAGRRGVVAQDRPQVGR